MANDLNIIKKGYAKDRYTLHEIEELKKCQNDPLYFIKNYVKISHPTKGQVPFNTYPYQEEVIKGFAENRKTILLISRQMGKCCSHTTEITKNKEKVNIGSLFSFNIKTKIVNCLENLLLKLVK